MKNGIQMASISGALLAGSMCVTGAAFAQQTTCDTITTVQSLIDAGSCRDQDKLYTVVSADDEVTGINLNISTAVFPGEDVHTVNLAGGTGFVSGNYGWTYTVEIVDNPATVGIDESTVNTFEDVSLGSDVPGASPDVRVTKDIIQDPDGAATALAPLVSVSGVEDGPVALCLTCTKLQVTDTYEVDQGVVAGENGQLLSSTNTFTQRTGEVPAPATLGLFGLGLLGLRWTRRIWS
jgi:hypothetical protein